MHFTEANDIPTNHHSKNQTSTMKMQRTCAIVGNGGILINSSCGEQINQHNMVIRSNLPTIEGFEPDVGDRVSVTSMNLVMLQAIVKEINHSKSTGRQAIKATRIQRLRHLNNTILWFPLNITAESDHLLTTLAKYCKESDILVQLAYSPISIRPATRR